MLLYLGIKAVVGLPYQLRNNEEG